MRIAICLILFAALSFPGQAQEAGHKIVFERMIAAQGGYLTYSHGGLERLKARYWEQGEIPAGRYSGTAALLGIAEEKVIEVRGADGSEPFYLVEVKPAHGLARRQLGIEAQQLNQIHQSVGLGGIVFVELRNVDSSKVLGAWSGEIESIDPVMGAQAGALSLEITGTGEDAKWLLAAERAVGVHAEQVRINYFTGSVSFIWNGLEFSGQIKVGQSMTISAHHRAMEAGEKSIHIRLTKEVSALADTGVDASVATVSIQDAANAISKGVTPMVLQELSGFSLAAESVVGSIRPEASLGLSFDQFCASRGLGQGIVPGVPGYGDLRVLKDGEKVQRSLSRAVREKGESLRKSLAQELQRVGLDYTNQVDVGRIANLLRGDARAEEAIKAIKSLERNLQRTSLDVRYGEILEDLEGREGEAALKILEPVLESCLQLRKYEAEVHRIALEGVERVTEVLEGPVKKLQGEVAKVEEQVRGQLALGRIAKRVCSEVLLEDRVDRENVEAAKSAINALRNGMPNEAAAEAAKLVGLAEEYDAITGLATLGREIEAAIQSKNVSVLVDGAGELMAVLDARLGAEVETVRREVAKVQAILDSSEPYEAVASALVKSGKVGGVTETELKLIRSAIEAAKEGDGLATIRFAGQLAGVGGDMEATVEAALIGRELLEACHSEDLSGIVKNSEALIGIIDAQFGLGEEIKKAKNYVNPVMMWSQLANDLDIISDEDHQTVSQAFAVGTEVVLLAYSGNIQGAMAAGMSGITGLLGGSGDAPDLSEIRHAQIMHRFDIVDAKLDRLQDSVVAMHRHLHEGQIKIMGMIAELDASNAVRANLILDNQQVLLDQIVDLRQYATKEFGKAANERAQLAGQIELIAGSIGSAARAPLDRLSFFVDKCRNSKVAGGQMAILASVVERQSTYYSHVQDFYTSMQVSSLSVSSVGEDARAAMNFVVGQRGAGNGGSLRDVLNGYSCAGWKQRALLYPEMTVRGLEASGVGLEVGPVEQSCCYDIDGVLDGKAPAYLSGQAVARAVECWAVVYPALLLDRFGCANTNYHQSRIIWNYEQLEGLDGPELAVLAENLEFVRKVTSELRSWVSKATIQSSFFSGDQVLLDLVALYESGDATALSGLLSAGNGKAMPRLWRRNLAAFFLSSNDFADSVRLVRAASGGVRVELLFGEDWMELVRFEDREDLQRAKDGVFLLLPEISPSMQGDGQPIGLLEAADLLGQIERDLEAREYLEYAGSLGASGLDQVFWSSDLLTVNR